MRRHRLRARCRARFAFALLAVCVATLPACELVRDPTPLEVTTERVAVHSVLIAGDSQAVVMLTRIPAVSRGQPLRPLPVSGATVRITGAGRTVSLGATGRWQDCIEEFAGASAEAETLKDACYVGIVPGGIVGGEVYELRVDRTSSADIITGRTEMPRPVEIRSPAAGATLEFRTDATSPPSVPALALTWSDPPAGHALHLRLKINHPTCFNSGLVEVDGRGQDIHVSTGTSLDLTGRDSVSVRGWYLSCAPLPSATQFDGALHFALYDASYTRHSLIYGPSSLPLEDVSIGLNGAIGVFGSVAVARLPVRVIRR
jgi:hypothetical protein